MKFDRRDGRAEDDDGECIFAIDRTVVYASLFGLVLVYAPAQILTAAGIAAPERMGPRQVAAVCLHNGTRPLGLERPEGAA